MKSNEVKPGDIVYYRGDWDADEPPTDEEMKGWCGSVVIKRGDELFLAHLEDNSLQGQEIHVSPYHPEYYFPTMKAALLAAADNEEHYGKKCLALAARLRELAGKVDR